MKIYYLNPPYSDLSIENQVLKGTGMELVPAAAQSEQDVISLAQEAAAILTAHVPIRAGIADHLRNCRIIVRLGVGYDIIDIESCKTCGILVCNVPDYGTEEVANHAHALCFAVHRRVLEYDRSVRERRWGYQVSSPIHRLSTLRAGVLGLGRIGSAFARGMKPFVQEVVAFDPFLTPEQFAARGILSASMEQIFETCDIISLHLPLSSKNHHLIVSRRSR